MHTIAYSNLAEPKFVYIPLLNGVRSDALGVSIEFLNFALIWIPENLAKSTK